MLSLSYNSDEGNAVTFTLGASVKNNIEVQGYMPH